MKTDIHPKYFDSVEIRCSCGNVVISGSTKESLKTELCSKCHPFYTGQQKLVDTAGRVDKFMEKRKKAASLLEATNRRIEESKKKPEAYVEKVVPQEVIDRASTKSGKWGSPLGETLTEETAKEEKVAAKKPAKAAKKSAVKKAPAKKPAKKK